MAKRLLRKAVDACERKIFLNVDLDATARGWHVDRPRPFVRNYRDPRWERFVAPHDAVYGSSDVPDVAMCRRRSSGGSP